MTREEAIRVLSEIIERYEKTDDTQYVDGWGIVAIGVAIEALKEQKTWKWIPVTSRPMDKEERKEWSDKLGYELDDEEAVIYSSLPDDGQEVLTCSKYGHIAMDIFCQDECGCYFDDNGEMDGIVAWMPLPEPYTEEK